MRKSKIILGTLALITLSLVSVTVVGGQCPPGMISYWKFDGDAADSYDDNDGTLMGGATFTTGQVGQAFSFDGVDDYVEGQYISGNTPRIGTIEGWVNIYSYPTRYRYGIITAAVEGQNICRFTDIVELQPDGKLSYYLWGYTGSYWRIFRPVSKTVLNLNEWYHVAVTVDGSNSKIYINGNLEASISSPYGYSGCYPAKFIFSNVNSCWGYSYSHDAFHGAIDEVAIYDRALTADEIQQHYQNGLNGLGYCVVVVTVEIDIKPGSDPNSINLKSKGMVPVAVLTTKEFDANTINPSTVVFAGAQPVRCTLEDVDGDDDMDMLFHFNTQDLNLDENSTEATLTGDTDEPPIQVEGTDTVNIVPKGKAKKPAAPLAQPSTWGQIKSLLK